MYFIIIIVILWIRSDVVKQGKDTHPPTGMYVHVYEFRIFPGWLWKVLTS